MAESNVLEHMAAATGHDSIAAYLKEPADAIRADPAALISQLQVELPESDRRIVADRQIREMLTRTYEEALRISHHGWVDDALAFCSSWGFDPADITVPVLLWHGGSDRFSPPSHTRWLASRIPDASASVERGAAHFRALEKLPDVLRWLASRPGRGFVPAGQPG